MIGQSLAFRQVIRMIEKVARCDASVLIEGETGTGKELAARAIHYGGTRRDGPFVPLNCGAVPADLLFNELFGHKRGAFTDAHIEQQGLVAHAKNGTLFLDEIDALTLSAQVSLLRFLQDLHYRPLGTPESVKADVRLIAATNADLEELAMQGRFRLDLLFRMRIMSVTLPPLRERTGDVPLLAESFLNACDSRFGLGSKHFDDFTLEWMNRYRWPGNIRELENFVYREYVLADKPTIRAGAPAAADIRLPDGHDGILPRSLFEDFKTAKMRAIAEFEARFLSRALHAADGNVTRAAKMVGKERRAFGKLLKKYGIRRVLEDA
ncbi:sigma 54-interacting transcriptional regulator [Caballeronia novacaledonica]|uniref:Sigma-54-dependent Fis family transcriptional regulator n=1 Tax=Caballeronia novacaledonica TaxID=1544861 RepID=A0AA37IFP2_9BURK|nr:sigma-54 dependent transcriptional regulator [Caballeronia novacaledonica]GJH28930.1 sigma-54-dependent Fis family transcriptional regulator [Caballeronia novacaledonica]